MRALLAVGVLVAVVAVALALLDVDALSGLGDAWRRHGGPGEPSGPKGYQRPPPPPGADLFVELVEPPAHSYAPPTRTAEDARLEALVVAAGARYDPALSHAARELAAWYARDNRLVPTNALAFLLDSAGAVAWGMRQAVLVTTREGDAPIIDAVSKQTEPGRDRVGVGEAWQLGDPPMRVITTVITGVAPELEPVPRTANVGSKVVIAGRLPVDYSAPGAVLMRPDLAMIPLEVAAHGDRFVTSFVPAEEGEWVVELLATGPRGPVPMAQLTVHAGVPLPRSFEGVWPPDESGIDSPEAAAEELAAFFSQERARYGLEPLQRDGRLDGVARAHSEDMRDHGFVGHHSPTTGDVGDRLRVAGYRTIAYAENVALNQSLWDAHAGLLRSLGHRRNILTRDLTHVGFAAASRGDDWFVTQVFSVPRPVVSNTSSARRTLLERLAGARREAGVRGLKEDQTLRRAAQREADRPDPEPSAALDQAKLRRRGTAWVVILSTLERFVPEGTLLDGAWRRVGVGVRQHDGRKGADIAVVMVLSE